MIYGAITNSWRNQLDDADLGDLIAEAQSRGAGHIELRQTCLGAAESGEGNAWRPDLETLANVVVRFPDLTFDLAVALPCITTDIDPDGGLYQSQLEAARLVGGGQPHLRTVDPGTSDTPWESPDDVAEAAARVAPLVREAARHGVIFSMENSGQPLRSMALLVQGGPRPTHRRGGPVPRPVPRSRQPAASPSRTVSRWTNWQTCPPTTSRSSTSSRPATASPSAALTTATWTATPCGASWRAKPTTAPP